MQDQKELKQKIRFSLPSKGVLAEKSLGLLAKCGLEIYKPNPRQYRASIPSVPGLEILFQRPGDIVSSIRNGSVDIGLTGLDIVKEHSIAEDPILILHDELGFGHCTLALAVPENMVDVQSVNDLQKFSKSLSHPLRIATKYPVSTEKFLKPFGLEYEMITSEGTLELAPSIGYADMISDLVSSGKTLQENRLRMLPDGEILHSQAALIANYDSLLDKPEAMQIVRLLLEYIEAYLRGKEYTALFANVRGASREDIAARIRDHKIIRGLDGPTISDIINRDGDTNWYAINIVVRKSDLFQAVNELRDIGGSGVVVTPVNYIFEEEPPRYSAMLKAVQERKIQRT
ncbi:MAG: ATP phosphoribosyltransferase [Anaerolineaceae bacterium]|nr:ATP phosphoribosyltransferase [Anaerolineaceae bacterium]